MGTNNPKGMVSRMEVVLTEEHRSSNWLVLQIVFVYNLPVRVHFSFLYMMYSWFGFLSDVFIPSIGRVRSPAMSLSGMVRKTKGSKLVWISIVVTWREENC